MSIDDIKSIAEIIQAALTSIGIIIAGIWTWYNFGLTRVSSPQVQISLDLRSVVKINNTSIAILALEVKNTGRTRVKLRRAMLAIRLFKVQEYWLPLARINSPLDFRKEVHNVLVDHSYLDPSEQYHEELGFIISGFDLMQVGVVFVGSKYFQTWEANYLFDITDSQTNQKSGATIS